MKKRLITAAIFAFFILVSLAGILVLKILYVAVIGLAALIMTFWPLSDACDSIKQMKMPYCLHNCRVPKRRIWKRSLPPNADRISYAGAQR
ncbi:MAG: hypothetical protein J5535_07145 [Firmicutes bacterium]|nr:hypothetical protein [Bacillota bacterium]